MNKQQIIAILEAFGVQAFDQSLVPVITAQLIINPALTDEQLASQEDGSIKHAIRQKIGWVVDLIWAAIEPYIDQAVRAAIATVRATSVAG